jgi:hypothetical protein
MRRAFDGRLAGDPGAGRAGRVADGFRVVGNRADADECFQEAFLGALAVSRREPGGTGGRCCNGWRRPARSIACASG